MPSRTLAMLLALVVLVLSSPAWARSEAADFRIRGIYVGMSEKQLQDTAGTLERQRRTDFGELDNNPNLEMFVLKKDRDTLVGIDRESRKVVFVMGSELTKEGSLLFLAGDLQFRAQLGLMPLKHDDNWIFHTDRFNIAIQFTRDASKTSPTIARVIVAEPSLPIKGGWLDGVDPRPGPSNNGTDVR